MNNRSDLTAILAIEEIEQRRLYRGDVSTHLQRAFGGHVLAQSLLAGYRTVPAGRRAHSLHAYFLRPGRTDLKVLYDVTHTRDGGSFTSRTVLARQGGTNIFTSAASFQKPEDGLEHSDDAPRNVPLPEDCPSLAEILARRSGRPAERWEEEWGVLDVRHVGDSGPDGTLDPGPRGARLQVWVRTSQPLPVTPMWHQAALAYLSDLTLLSASTVPHRVMIGSPHLMAASLDHSMWFHRPFAADQWLLYDQFSPSASGGRGFATGRLFQDGQLVASCAQEGLIRVVDPRRLGPADRG